MDKAELDWDIAKSLHRCTRCDKEFAEEEPYCSALYDTGVEFERKDFCTECWDAPGEPHRERAFSFWKTEIPRADEPRKVFVDDNVIFDFFQRLAPEEDQPTKRNFRYILGLMLMRKKKLKFKDVVREDDREYLILRRSRTKEEHRVLNPQLTDEETEQVRQELTQILETQVL
ncbi:MAG: hypothetical protein ABIF82_15605 [Planctomycetota bacterium]